MEAATEADFLHFTGDSSGYKLGPNVPDSTALAAKATGTWSRPAAGGDTVSGMGTARSSSFLSSAYPTLSGETFRVTRMNPRHLTSLHLSAVCPWPVGCREEAH